MKRNARSPVAFTAGLVVLAALGGTGCKKKVTQAQCDELLDRFAALVVHEKLKDATAEQIKTEQAREREEAKADDNFGHCTSELSTEDYACAMAAQTSDALVKCLE
jgi:hypothetical protein